MGQNPRQGGYANPAESYASITKSDSVDLPGGICRGIYVGVTGDIKVTGLDATAVTFSNVPVGVQPICAVRVWSTGTTASSMIALY